ncbi:hypothetical protein Moror_13389 [Moniliophthora roreri MCA 2997]|uniref:CCHC-type domain-containing protein n=1 Tax=Moniliophthora roreri (strain MCA 2997) TaxID=1381753 RepID=V2XNJ2_MONRO|nr:hypothetical protein Moror_13389 [Moniliophthora roreri MCA 2997]
MTDGPGEFWKNEKMDPLLSLDAGAEKVTWGEFIEDFKTSFELLDTALEAQMKLRDLKIKERADEYTYQFAYLAKQTGYNNAVQIKAFKQGLPRSLMLKIMTQPEGKPETIKDWMNVAILFDESYKQAVEYGKVWDEENGRKPQWAFQKKEGAAVKKITEFDRKEYMAKGLCFQCGRSSHRICDCPDGAKGKEVRKEEPKKLTKEERFAKIQALVNEQTDEEKNQLLDLMEQTAEIDRNSMHLPLQYKVGTQTVKNQALLDSGAGGRFISLTLARKLGKKWEKLPEHIKVFNVDGTLNKTAWISHAIKVEFRIQEKTFKEKFLISGIREEEMILGLPWLRLHSSKINWKTGEMEFPPRRKIQIKHFTGVLDNTPMEILIGAKTMASREFAHQKEEAKKSIDKLIPLYLQGYRHQFEKGKSEHFPPSQTYDHAIELKPDFVPRNCKLYPLSPMEQQEQNKFLEENL